MSSDEAFVLAVLEACKKVRLEASGRPKDLAQLPVLRETLRVSRAVKRR